MLIKKLFLTILFIFLLSATRLNLFSNNKNLLINSINDILKKYSLSNDEFLIYLNSFEKLPYLYPLLNSKGIILQKYGAYLDENFKALNLCTGILFETERGCKVISTTDGKIYKIIKNEEFEAGDFGALIYRAYDYRIIISHNYGFFTVYCNIKNIFVKENEKVKKGQIIGEINENPQLKKSYFFYQVKNGEKLYDPMNFILITE